MSKEENIKKTGKKYKKPTKQSIDILEKRNKELELEIAVLKDMLKKNY